MNHRISQLFSRQPETKVMSVFTTAGFPGLYDTIPVCRALQQAGVDMIELGFPFSDPLADGPTIQASNSQALQQGMSLSVLFQQLRELRTHVSIPVLLMGYLNPVLQYGMERFCRDCHDVGIDGLILPDLPFDQYLSEYKALWDSYQIASVFLITEFTSPERIRAIDQHTNGFLYVVSSAAVTGDRLRVDQSRTAYFQRIQNMHLHNPCMVGFGIRDADSFRNSVQYAQGGILGSAFLEAIRDTQDLESTIVSWVQQIRKGANLS